MKQLRKLVFVIVAVCMISASFVSVSHETAYALESDYSNDLSFLTSLGITESVDISNPDAAVSRAEFVAMAVKIINPNLNIKFNGNFSDVTSGTRYSNEIYTAFSYGLLHGTSDGTFSPESPITYAAALKILVAALGYEEYAYVNGGYPTGYMIQAKNVGITDGVAAYGANDSITFKSAVALISNSLKCDLRKIVSIHGDYVETKVAYGTNCLGEYFNLKTVSGILYTAGSHSLIDGYFAEESMAQIDDVILYSSVDGLEKYLGYNVTAWYDGNKNELRAFSVSPDIKTVSFDVKDVESYDDFEINVYESNANKIKTYRLDKGFSFVLNGRAIAPKASDFVFHEGKITLINNSDGNDYDVVVAEKKEYYVVKSVNYLDMTVYDKHKSDSKLVLKNEDGYFSTLEKDGVAIEPGMLAKEDVLEVYQSNDGFVSKVKVSSAFVKGTITEIGKTTISVDGKPYEFNEYFKTYFAPEPGQNGTFLLDADGKITYISSLYRENVEYGFFLDFGGKTSGLSSERKIKLLTEKGEVKIYELSDKVKLDNMVYTKDSAVIRDTFMNGDNPRYQLIRFGKDAAGRVNLIDTSSKVSEKNIDLSLPESDKLIEKYDEVFSTEDSLTKYVDASETSAYWRATGSAFIPFFTVGNTILISVPSTLKPAKGAEPQYNNRFVDDAFSIITTSSLSSYGSYSVDAYDYDESMIPKVVVVYNGTAEPGVEYMVSPSASANIHVVENVVDVLTEEGEKTKRIYAYANQMFVIADIDPNLCELFELKSLIPSPGDVVRLSFGTKYIKGIAVDCLFNEETNALDISYKGSISTNPTSILTYVSGDVFSYDGKSSLVIKTDNYPVSSSYPSPKDGLCSVMVTSSTQVILYDTKTGTISHGRMSDIKDIRSVGADEASYVCVRLNGYDPKTVVIYK